MKYDWQLINDNFSEVDREEVISWLRRNPRLTQGPKVKEFEDAWSEWLGVKHSVFVNSGASANFIMFCIANELSQSKVTGLLGEEALRNRGELNESFDPNNTDKGDLINFSSHKETFSEIKKSSENGDDYTVNKKVLSDDIKMMHEFIEFKYFKKVMKRNNNIFE